MAGGSEHMPRLCQGKASSKANIFVQASKAKHSTHWNLLYSRRDRITSLGAWKARKEESPASQHQEGMHAVRHSVSAGLCCDVLQLQCKPATCSQGS